MNTQGRARVRKACVLALFGAAGAASFIAAFLVRFEFDIPPDKIAALVATLPIVLAWKIAACVLGREWMRGFRYVGIEDLVRIVEIHTVGMFFFLGANYLWPAELFIPRSVLFLDWGISILLASGLRSGYRIGREFLAPWFRRDERQRAILYGSTESAVAVVRMLQHSMLAAGHKVVAMIDEQSPGAGTLIAGIPVYGSIKDLPLVAELTGATQVFVLGSPPGRRLRDVLDECKQAKLAAKVVPCVTDLVNGKYEFRIRDVEINDLLRREPAQLDTAAIRRFISGKTAWVTGGAGSIGSEICRQIAALYPRTVVIVDHSETAVFDIQQEFQERFPDIRFRYVVADVCNPEGMTRLMTETTPDVIFHAAAYKHVPLMEHNCREAIRNNVFGTKTIASLADEFGVQAFVLISTDKAVRPSSVMGRTKLLAETYVQSLAQASRTRFVTVRFGNVLNSVGSVVPIFRRQIETGGPITVTHPEMHRFFMTIPEAVQLVLQAGAIGEGGDVLVLDMGEPIKIVDLAKEMIYLSGLKHPEDIGIVFTGLRPGEKLTEELFYADESERVKVHDKIYRANSPAPSLMKVNDDLTRLDDISLEGNAEARAILENLVNRYIHSTRQKPVGVKTAA